MANGGWLDKYENDVVNFLPEGEYDHCPGIISVHNGVEGKRPFRFFNMWMNNEGFLDIVKDVWLRPVVGCPMFKVTQKLKMLKVELKKLNQNGFSEIQGQALQAYKQMIAAQNQVHAQVRDAACIAAEKRATEHYKQIHGRYLSFLRQKTK